MATVNFNEEETINVTLQDANQINVDLPPINYIPGYKEAEAERRANEVVRQSNEADRIALYNDMEYKLETGYFNGEDGEDGFSPTIETAKEGKVTTITIEDAIGTKTATILDGSDGEAGEDGFSPIANVSKSGDTATITITDAVGTTTTSVKDGSDGADGTDGVDGFSPIANVSKSGGTTTITITDATGTTTANVNDGQTITILTYGQSSWNDFITAYNNNSIVYVKVIMANQTCRLGHLAWVDNITNPTKAEFHYYRSVATHTDSQQGDELDIYTVKSPSGWTVTTRQVYTKIDTGTGISGSYDQSTGTKTLSANIVTSIGSSSTDEQIPSAKCTYEELSGKQSTINSSNKLSSDLVDDTNNTNKFMTSSEKIKLSGIATGAEVNVQSNWNETDSSSDAYIQNKPTNVSAFTNDAGYLTQHQDISGKVSKAGDTMTGDLTLQNSKVTANEFKIVDSYNNNAGIRLSQVGGTGTNNMDFGYQWDNYQGAGAAFRSKDSGEPGVFIIWARSSAGTKRLKGEPNGNLTWDGKGIEFTNNKVTSLSSSSTDTQYPSAKCVYDMIGNVESILETLTTGGGVN